MFCNEYKAFNVIHNITHVQWVQKASESWLTQSLNEVIKISDVIKKIDKIAIVIPHKLKCI